MDVLGRSITDPYQAFSDLLLFLLPSAPGNLTVQYGTGTCFTCTRSL
eukprot:COSAG01_NODE_458_length_16743_cov_124.609208_9_plen_47_part_00